uniref:Tetraspanin-32 n=1 Tax=Propithecus coquereli TaxID=379532 RepID=A0A2K6G023_PROCO
AHFAVISRASLERNPYEIVHCWAFYAGMSLAGLLSLGAVLSAAATVREAQGLMAGVEDAALDTYDLVYDQVVKTASPVRQQELAAIQDAFLCCGKRSPFSRLGRAEAGLCQGEEAAREDCLQGIRSHLRPYQSVLSTLSGIGLALTGCALLLSAFLWFAIRSGRSLDRKGKYSLAARACGCQPQEPGVFRHCRDGPAPRAPSGADAVGDSEPRGGSWTADSPLPPLSCHRPPSACRDPHGPCSACCSHGLGG